MPKRILLAEDNVVDMMVTRRLLRADGFEVVEAADGNEAWGRLQQPDCPALVILDWIMPGLDGVELCRRIRASGKLRSLYIILLTGRTRSDDVVLGLDAGADDYIQKPVVAAELLARVRVGQRVSRLQTGLTAHVRQLEEASSRIRQLQDLIPMCCVCKRVRQDENYWEGVESYITKSSGMQITHGYCPDCVARLMESELEHAGGGA